MADTPADSPVQKVSFRARGHVTSSHRHIPEGRPLGEGGPPPVLQGGRPHSFPCVLLVSSGPILLLTSDNIKQRLGTAALDRYAGLLGGTAWPSCLLPASPSSALKCAPRCPRPVSAFQSPRVPAVQLAGAAGGRPPHRALPGGQHAHALDPALHPAGRLHPHRGPGRPGTHTRPGLDTHLQ